MGVEKKLHDYPRPTVAVDTALLTWDPDRGLLVVEMARDDVGKWALPGIVDGLGEQALFYGESFRYIPNALTRYRRETIRLIAEMTMGTGALVMIGGTVGVAAFMTLASGGVIAVQGYSSLGNIGIEALTGFLSAFLNVRIVAPIIAGIALAATIGAGCTAQLGAMRVAEEIDAVESMAVHSVSYLVSTRIIAGLIAVIPLYALAVLASFFAARATTVYINGQSAGRTAWPPYVFDLTDLLHGGENELEIRVSNTLGNLITETYGGAQPPEYPTSGLQAAPQLLFL